MGLRLRMSRALSLWFCRFGHSSMPATTGVSLYPNKETRDLLPSTALVYMGPGGHRQWPMSIVAMTTDFHFGQRH